MMSGFVFSRSLQRDPERFKSCQCSSGQDEHRTKEIARVMEANEDDPLLVSKQ
jgi:hypothetical protein